MNVATPRAGIGLYRPFLSTVSAVIFIIDCGFRGSPKHFGEVVVEDDSEEVESFMLYQAISKLYPSEIVHHREGCPALIGAPSITQGLLDCRLEDLFVCHIMSCKLCAQYFLCAEHFLTGFPERVSQLIPSNRPTLHSVGAWTLLLRVDVELQPVARRAVIATLLVFDDDLWELEVPIKELQHVPDRNALPDGNTQRRLSLLDVALLLCLSKLFPLIKRNVLLHIMSYCG